MDWNKGYSAIYYAAFVDPGTWRDIERFEITGGSISRQDSDLMESADLDCVNYNQGERWVRVWMDTLQRGSSGHNALFTGLACCPSEDIEGFRIDTQVQLYSVLKPADDVLLPRGWYAAAGVSGALIIRDLLSVSPAPVIIDGEAPALAQAIIAEDTESRLTMAHKILDTIGWRFRISGMGEIHICPKASEVSARFDTLENDSIEPKLSKKFDWFACPNVFRAVADDLSATVRDDDPDSPLSTVSRGREIWKEETACDLAEGESVADYAIRRLKEEQMVETSVSYDRRYHPDVLVSDWVYLNYPKQGIVGTFQVKNQSIELGAGCPTSEDVVKV